ncbi:MAG: DNA glycosylase [Eubacteriales bacterium]|nr:DNA glycosylase [Eubacteriales bacterium]
MPVEIQTDFFDPIAILESGQCFRMVRLTEDTVETIASGRRVAVTTLGEGRFRFDCTPAEFDSFWRGYFALDMDYAAIRAAAPPEDSFLTRALAEGRGLRILRQDPWETLCGFIVSQRKHILAIRSCMEALCDRFGDPVPGTARKSFPTPQRLAAAAEGEICLCGPGYRVPYLLDAARRVAGGQIDLQALYAAPDDALFTALTQVHGVGVKVADCVMLFAYARYARAPVDVWIHRVIEEEYGGQTPFPGYGPNAGIYQQYMFVLKRDQGRAGRASSTK